MKSGESFFNSIAGALDISPGTVTGTIAQAASMPALPWEVPSPGAKRSISVT